MNNRNMTIVLSALFALVISGPLVAEEIPIGEREFKSYCGGCHGLDGKGNGPLVEFLNRKPKSLTTLARENQGVFPFRRVYEVIDGTYEVGAHGTRDMPVWGERYAMDIIKDYGEFGTEHPKTVRCRILEVVFFLANIQER
jgi:mono/diheme cytochrome c family protein